MSLPSEIAKIGKLATVFVIFGATGDLARRRIFPALYQLSTANLLPETFKIVASARSQHSSQPFRSIVKQSIQSQGPLEQNQWQKFVQKIVYIPSDVAKDINLPAIAQEIANFEKETAACVNRIFYMAIAPNILGKSISTLGKNKFHLGCPNHHQKPKIIIEKPFGQDLTSAQELAQTLTKYFGEEQIYRIDHYLGKETVQNIFAFRFGNDIFEPIWNNAYIDHVQITTAEDTGVGRRGEFYDKTGALRDIIQNHQLQLLALATMNEPVKFETVSIRQKKLEILSSIRKLTKAQIPKITVRGQYQGYLEEEKIAPNSQTETYALVKLFIETDRWRGIPFYLRTGKKLAGRVTSVILAFKEKGHKFFEKFWQHPIPNHITIQIQPNEGIGVRLVAKKPGLTTQLEPVDMEFCYRRSFDVPQPEAYERLLLDVILGDQSLFISQKEVEESWRVIDPIRQAWDADCPPLAIYKPGSWGPKEADKLIESDHRQFLAPLLTICKI